MSNPDYIKESFYKLSINKKKQFIKENPEYNVYLTGNKRLSSFKDKVDILTLNKQDLLAFIESKMNEALSVESGYKRYHKIVNTFAFVNFALLNNNADKEVFDYLFFYPKNNNIKLSAGKYNTTLNNFQTIVRYAHNLTDSELLDYYSKCNNYIHALTQTELILKASQNTFERLLKILSERNVFKIKRCINYYEDNSISKENMRLVLNYKYNVNDFLSYYRYYSKWHSDKVKKLFELCREDFNKFKHVKTIKENLSYIDNMIFI